MVNEIEELKQRLETALLELQQMRAENAVLKERLAALEPQHNASVPVPDAGPAETPVTAAPVDARSSNADKVRLFLELFRGREDVYAKRWVGKDGKSGYSPACANAWVPGVCGRYRHVKCANCDQRALLPYDDKAVEAHLRGDQIVGIYPLCQDDSCWFLAVDFDKASWQTDVIAFRDCCTQVGVPVVVERSRSGNGAHVWVFFVEPVPASVARELGSRLLTKALEQRHQIGLDSYDRLFPNQDTIPVGGFGNLIALPLQKQPRAQGNSVFVDERLQPYADQWALLSSVRRLRLDEVQSINSRIGSANMLGELVEDEEAADDLPWEAKPVQHKIQLNLLGNVQVVASNMIYVETAGLPQNLLNCIARLAAFRNPDFYRAQAMRFPIFNKPRVIHSAELHERHLAIPRGCKEQLGTLMANAGANLAWVDKTNRGREIAVAFRGELSSLQQRAGEELLRHDNGVLSAATGFGKTVVAAWLIAERRTNVLVVVHRRQLLDQWKVRLSSFLGLPSESIGEVGGGRNRRTGLVDVAIMQSLNRKGTIEPFVRDYGMIIVDECHHISAFSFEQVLKYATARFVYGFSATPTRKDGHHPLVYMQCGPIRFKVDVRSQAAASPFSHTVITRRTSFRMPEHSSASRWSIQECYSAMIENEERNDLIFNDICAALDQGYSPLVLTERASHLAYWANRLQGFAKNIVVMKGGMGKKQRAEIERRLASIPDDTERLLLATGRYVGEGFDDARLNALFLTMPISWKGTLTQYVGRLHRSHDQKREVRVYDYVDALEPVLLRMYRKRLAGYRAMGYVGKDDHGGDQ